MDYLERKLLFEEWKSSKDLMDKFGDRIYDLRKYGFSFITALLTAQTILIPSYMPVTINQTNLPNTIKVAVIGVTILLIVTLYFFEKSYQILLDAANQRAIMIEYKLNLELLGTVSYHSNFRRVNWYNTGIYVAFIIAALILAYFTVPSLYYWTWIFGILAIIGLALVQFLPRSMYFDNDWSINKVEFQIGEIVEITCTYFGKYKIRTHKKDERVFDKEFAWRILNQDGEFIFHEPAVKKNGTPIVIPKKQSYTWFWDTTDYPEGIYQLLPERWNRPLLRKIKLVKEKN